MTISTKFINELEPLHEDAFGWAVVCRGGDVDMAADALQEAYLKVVSGLASFGGRSSLKTWWLGVVRFTVLEQQRESRRWRRMAERLLGWISLIGPESYEGQGEGIDVLPDVESLNLALGQLPARQSEILHLVFQEQCSLGEAAMVMEISIGSARQHYDRAKRKLRSLLCETSTFTTNPAVCTHAD